MDPRSREYPIRSRVTMADDPDMRSSVTAAALSFDQRRRVAYAEVDADAWRDWAERVKDHVLTHLDAYLEQAEDQLTLNGAHVHWAENAGDVHGILDRLVEEHGVRTVVKGKSMLSEELGVNQHLADLGVEPVETDLGEYIIQLLDEPPSHIIGPAIHRSLDDVRALFHEAHQTAPDAAPEHLAAAARERLRQAFLSAEMGITGGNFLVAETGTLALIENEGNIRLSTSAPRVHVALVGIEKLLPRWSDLATFLQLTSRAATGQAIGTFVSLINGPRTPQDPDGPEAVHVILVDNGRTGVLADPEAWQSLRCVRCGACLNTCPVYRQTGGHAYGWVYSGPIGAVLAPGLLGLEEALPLPFASSLCGACADVCPVRIPIPEMLLMWRRRAVEQGLLPRSEGLAFKAFAAAAGHATVFGPAARAATKALDGVGRRLPVLGSWTEGRAAPVPAALPFGRMWKRGLE